MTELIAKLPDADQILKRLKTVRDTQYTDPLYGQVTNHANTVKIPYGILAMFTYGIETVAVGYPAFERTLLYLDIPGWIDALIDDRRVAEATKALFEESMRDTK